MKIIFFLMSGRGLDVLNFLITSGNSQLIKCIVTSKDDNVDNDYYDEICDLCKLNDLLVVDKSQVVDLDADYYVAISWRWLIKCDYSKLVIIHDSLLPKYRGFSPLVSALINGEKEIGATAILGSKEFDRGDIISQERISISYPIKIEEAIRLTSRLYVSILANIIAGLKNKQKLTLTKQDESEATYSVWRDEEDYIIDWNCSAAYINRKIDAQGYPYKGALSFLDKKGVRIFDAEQMPDVRIENRTAGKILFIEEGFPLIICGEGLLKIKSAKWDDGSDFFPLKKFRQRFKNSN